MFPDTLPRTCRAEILGPGSSITEVPPGFSIVKSRLGNNDAFEMADAEKLKSLKERAASRQKDDGEGDLSSVFAQLDTDCDGTLTRDEIVKNCHLLKLSAEEANQLFDKLDADGDGELSIEEFMKAAKFLAIRKKAQAMKEKKAEEAALAAEAARAEAEKLKRSEADKKSKLADLKQKSAVMREKREEELRLRAVAAAAKAAVRLQGAARRHKARKVVGAKREEKKAADDAAAAVEAARQRAEAERAAEALAAERRRIKEEEAAATAEAARARKAAEAAAAEAARETTKTAAAAAVAAAEADLAEEIVACRRLMASAGDAQPLFAGTLPRKVEGAGLFSAGWKDRMVRLHFDRLEVGTVDAAGRFKAATGGKEVGLLPLNHLATLHHGDPALDPAAQTASSRKSWLGSGVGGGSEQSRDPADGKSCLHLVLRTQADERAPVVTTTLKDDPCDASQAGSRLAAALRSVISVHPRLRAEADVEAGLAKALSSAHRGDLVAWEGRGRALVESVGGVRCLLVPRLAGMLTEARASAAAIDAAHASWREEARDALEALLVEREAPDLSATSAALALARDGVALNGERLTVDDADLLDRAEARVSWLSKECDLTAQLTSSLSVDAREQLAAGCAEANALRGQGSLSPLVEALAEKSGHRLAEILDLQEKWRRDTKLALQGAVSGSDVSTLRDIFALAEGGTNIGGDVLSLRHLLDLIQAARARINRLEKEEEVLARMTAALESDRRLDMAQQLDAAAGLRSEGQLTSRLEDYTSRCAHRIREINTEHDRWREDTTDALQDAIGGFDIAVLTSVLTIARTGVQLNGETVTLQSSCEELLNTGDLRAERLSILNEHAVKCISVLAIDSRKEIMACVTASDALRSGGILSPQLDEQITACRTRLVQIEEAQSTWLREAEASLEEATSNFDASRLQDLLVDAETGVEINGDVLVFSNTELLHQANLRLNHLAKLENLERRMPVLLESDVRSDLIDCIAETRLIEAEGPLSPTIIFKLGQCEARVCEIKDAQDQWQLDHASVLAFAVKGFDLQALGVKLAIALEGVDMYGDKVTLTGHDDLIAAARARLLHLQVLDRLSRELTEALESDNRLALMQAANAGKAIKDQGGQLSPRIGEQLMSSTMRYVQLETEQQAWRQAAARTVEAAVLGFDLQVLSEALTVATDGVQMNGDEVTLHQGFEDVITLASNRMTRLTREAKFVERALPALQTTNHDAILECVADATQISSLEPVTPLAPSTEAVLAECKDKLAKLDGSAVRLQGQARKRQASLRVEGLREEKKRNGDAAIKLQGLVRKHEAKKLLVAKRVERAVRTHGATKVQGVVRQRSARKVVSKRREERGAEMLASFMNRAATSAVGVEDDDAPLSTPSKPPEFTAVASNAPVQTTPPLRAPIFKLPEKENVDLGKASSDQPRAVSATSAADAEGGPAAIVALRRAIVEHDREKLLEAYAEAVATLPQQCGAFPVVQQARELITTLSEAFGALEAAVLDRDSEAISWALGNLRSSGLGQWSTAKVEASAVTSQLRAALGSGAAGELQRAVAAAEKADASMRAFAQSDGSSSGCSGGGGLPVVTARMLVAAKEELGGVLALARAFTAAKCAAERTPAVAEALRAAVEAAVACGVRSGQVYEQSFALAADLGVQEGLPEPELGPDRPWSRSRRRPSPSPGDVAVTTAAGGGGTPRRSSSARRGASPSLRAGSRGSASRTRGAHAASGTSPSPRRGSSARRSRGSVQFNLGAAVGGDPSTPRWPTDAESTAEQLLKKLGSPI